MKYSEVVERRRVQIGWFTLLFTLGCYLYAVFSYTSIMPIMDDYDVVLRFLEEFNQADLWGKFDLLVAQHGEHRLVFNRIIELIYVMLHSNINFFHLVIFGNIGWFLVLLLLWKIARESKTADLFMFLPVVFFMLTFAHAALMTWPMASIQQYWQLFFALFSIYMLIKTQYAVAILLIFLSIMSGGGGLILIPIFLLYTLFEKKWKLFGLFLLIFIGIVWIYFIGLHYEHSMRHPGIMVIVSNIPSELFCYILLFLGNFGKIPILAYGIGTVFLLFGLYNFRYLARQLPFIAWSTVFIVAIACAAGLSRVDAGAQQALSSRYAIYSLLMASLIYLGYLNRYQENRRVFSFGLILSVSVFGYYLFFGINAMKERKHDAETKLLYVSPGHAEGILKRSALSGIFDEWEGRIALPSKLLHLKETGGKGDFNFTIGGKLNVSSHNFEYSNTKQKTLHLLLKDRGIDIDGWISGRTLDADPCAVIISIDDRKKLFYLEKNTKNGRYTQLNAHLDTSYLKGGMHKLKIRLVTATCEGYYKTLTLPIKIDPLEKTKMLPAYTKGMHGMIEKFSVKSGKFYLQGWYFIENISSNRYSFIIEIDNKRFFATKRILRPDVAKVFDSDLYNKTGFIFEVPVPHIGKGNHIIKIFILLDDEKTLYVTPKTYRQES